VCRPLFVVDNHQLVVRKSHIHLLRNDPTNYTWTNLMQAGVVEYVDTEVSSCITTTITVVIWQCDTVDYVSC
jgi:DNA-directed RNA polymerase II subunit RPB2